MENLFGLLVSIALGAIFGSYATLFAYRLPLRESCFGRYFGPKSRCPSCSTIIKTRELIPLLNWVFTLGKCRSCKIKIPRTHLFVEVATTSLFVLCYLKFGLSQEFIAYSIICVGCVILLTTDFTHRIFPQEVLNLIVTIGLACRVLQDQNMIDAIFSAAIGVAFAVFFYQIFYKKTSAMFANQDQSFDYTKFILVAAICMKLQLFFFYFFAVMMILTVLLILEVPIKKNRNNFGYALILPYLWLMLFPPLSI